MGGGGYPLRVTRTRLDALLVQRGLSATRSRAQAEIMAGRVMVDGARAHKPGQQVPPDAVLEVEEGRRFVSRAGDKLANALDRAEVDVTGVRALDVGASTGGFTDCLLQRGAAGVIAVDVGYGQLAWSLRQDPRVTVLERTNARHLTRDQLPYPPDFVTVDVSFISVALVWPAVVACCADAWRACLMVKPQFEVGRGDVGSGGVVRDHDARRRAVERIGDVIEARGGVVLDAADSGLAGPKGNREVFLIAASSADAAPRDGDWRARVADAVAEGAAR